MQEAAGAAGADAAQDGTPAAGLCGGVMCSAEQDYAGNTVEQTLIRAYALEGSHQGNDRKHVHSIARGSAMECAAVKHAALLG